MAWSWSHTDEAYYNAEQNTRKAEREWLEVCWAEIQSYKEDLAEQNAERVRNGEEPELYPVCHDQYFSNLKYEAARVKAKLKCRESLADEIWEYARERRTCTNGGWEAYCCPFGCHMVSFDSKEDE